MSFSSLQFLVQSTIINTVQIQQLLAGERLRAPTAECQDLIRQMLALDAWRRPSLERILEHPFLVRHCGRTLNGADLLASHAAPAVLVTPPPQPQAQAQAHLVPVPASPGRVLRSVCELTAVPVAVESPPQVRQLCVRIVCDMAHKSD